MRQVGHQRLIEKWFRERNLTATTKSKPSKCVKESLCQAVLAAGDGKSERNGDKEREREGWSVSELASSGVGELGS